MTRVFVGLGSNVEPKQAYIEKAFAIIQMQIATSGFKASTVYRSAPYKGKIQDEYLNAACVFDSDLSAEELLKELLSIEVSLGRVRDGGHWEPRTIDLDILLYGESIIDVEGLRIPHYDLKGRDFFLVPLLELEPNLAHPDGETLKDVLRKLPQYDKTQLIPL